MKVLSVSANRLDRASAPDEVVDAWADPDNPTDRTRAYVFTFEHEGLRQQVWMRADGIELIEALGTLEYGSPAKATALFEALCDMADEEFFDEAATRRLRSRTPDWQKRDHSLTEVWSPMVVFGAVV